MNRETLLSQSPQRIPGHVLSRDGSPVFQLLDCIGELGATVDLHLRFGAINKAFRDEFARTFGIKVRTGDRLDEILTRLLGDRDKASVLCQRATAGEAFTAVEELGEGRHQGKIFSLRFSPLRDGQENIHATVMVIRDVTEQRLGEMRFSALMEAAPDAMLVIRPDGAIQRVNAQAERMFGHSREKMIDRQVAMLLPERFRAGFAGFPDKAEAEPSILSAGGRLSLWGLRADGTEFPAEISLNPFDIDGVTMVAGAIRDMTIRQQAESRLRELSGELELRVTERTQELERANRELSRRLSALRVVEAALMESALDFRATFEQAAVGLAHVALDGRWLRMNDRLCDLSGYLRSELAGMHFRQLIHPQDIALDADMEARLLSGALPSYSLEKRCVRKGGDIAWVNLTASLVRDQEHQPRYFIFVVEDITLRKQAEESARQAALHDSLTGLPNRALLFEYAPHLLAHTRRTHRNAAVMFIDLDRFKPINDTYGHEVGDAVLREVACRLRNIVREEDMVFRLGGDEFLVFLPNISKDKGAADVARHIVDDIGQPYRFAGLELTLSSSVGVSIYPRDGHDIDSLIHRADVAMYQAKQHGRNNFQFYSERLAERAHQQTAIETKVRTALAEGEFRLYYQPVIDIDSRRVIGVEALLRWPHEDIGPERFVPVAESAGLIDSLGVWVLSEACRQHHSWRGEGLPSIPIAVNVSAVQFRHKHFAEQFGAIMRELNISPDALQLELTETALMENVDHAIEALVRFKDLGIKIALDDFGTGYSSLSYLSRLPIDKIKVDKSFVHRIDSDQASRAVTEAIIALGRMLNLEIVAEGIESADEMDYLRSHGCHQAQGFHVCAPVAADDFSSWYRIWHGNA